MADSKIRVTVRMSFSGNGWSCEKGDEITVPLADARRMSQRGLVGPPSKVDEADHKEARAAYDKAMRMNEQELAEARKVDHHTRPTEAARIRLGLRKEED